MTKTSHIFAIALLALGIVRPVSTFAHGEAPAALNGLVGVDEEIIAVEQT